MSGMFSKCSSLKEINISNFRTNNVQYMNKMFFGCSSLEEVNLSNFKPKKRINIYQIFYGCSSLTELSLSNVYVNDIIFIHNLISISISENILNELNKIVENNHKNKNLIKFNNY